MPTNIFGNTEAGPVAKESEINFFPGGGHDHDGVNSTPIFITDGSITLSKLSPSLLSYLQGITAASAAAAAAPVKPLVITLGPLAPGGVQHVTAHWIAAGLVNDTKVSIEGNTNINISFYHDGTFGPTQIEQKFTSVVNGFDYQGVWNHLDTTGGQNIYVGAINNGSNSTGTITITISSATQIANDTSGVVNSIAIANQSLIPPAQGDITFTAGTGIGIIQTGTNFTFTAGALTGVGGDPPPITPIGGPGSTVSVDQGIDPNTNLPFITVNWTYPFNNAGVFFKLQLVQKDDTGLYANGVVSTGETQALTFSFGNGSVIPGLKYQVVIFVITTAGQLSPYLTLPSLTTYYTASSSPAVPPSVTGFHAFGAVDSVIVIMDSLDTNVIVGSYEVQLSTTNLFNPGDPQYADQHSPGTIFGFPNLTPSTQYYARARALSTAVPPIVGPWSSIASCPTHKISDPVYFDVAVIQTAAIADAAIINAKIANATITDAKIHDLKVDKLTAGSISAALITVTGSGTNGGTLHRANGSPYSGQLGQLRFGNVIGSGLGYTPQYMLMDASGLSAYSNVTDAGQGPFNGGDITTLNFMLDNGAGTAYFRGNIGSGSTITAPVITGGSFHTTDSGGSLGYINISSLAGAPEQVQFLYGSGFTANPNGLAGYVSLEQSVTRPFGVGTGTAIKVAGAGANLSILEFFDNGQARMDSPSGFIVQGGTFLVNTTCTMASTLHCSGAFEVQGVSTFSNAVFVAGGNAIQFNGGQGLINDDFGTGLKLYGSQTVALDCNGNRNLVCLNDGSTHMGTAYTNGSLIVSSIEIKENIKESSLNALDIVNSVKTYNYKYKNGNTEVLGHLAEEVLRAYPIAVKDVHEDADNGKYAIDTYTMIATLWKAVQELSAKLDGYTGNNEG